MMKVKQEPTGEDGASSSIITSARKKRKPVPLRQDQIRQVTMVDKTGKEKIVEEISLLDSGDEGDNHSEQPKASVKKKKKKKRSRDTSVQITMLDEFMVDTYGRKYYKGFVYLGHTYRLGDHVLLGGDEVDYLGIVEQIFYVNQAAKAKIKEAKGDHLVRKFMLKVRWFFQQFDIEDEKRKGFVPNKGFATAAQVQQEIFWSFTHDENPITSVKCPIRVIYCPAATDPHEMAALCQREPNTWFCRYIYHQSRYYHIHNWEEEWDDYDADRRDQVRALHEKLQQEGVQFPSSEPEASSDPDFDADADDSCPPEPLDAVKKPSSRASITVEVKREPRTVGGESSGHSGSSEEYEDGDEDEDEDQDNDGHVGSGSMNGMTFILDDTPLDDDDDDDDDADQDGGQAISATISATPNKRSRDDKGQAESGKRRRRSDDAGARLVNIAAATASNGANSERTPKRRRASLAAESTSSTSSTSSPTLADDGGTSATKRQKLKEAAKAGKSLQREAEDRTAQENAERREINRRRQQLLDEELKKVTFRPRKRSLGKSVVIDVPATLPPNTDASEPPPRLRLRRASLEKVDGDRHAQQSTAQEAAPAPAPASAPAPEHDDSEPLDLSDHGEDRGASTTAAAGEPTVDTIAGQPAPITSPPQSTSTTASDSGGGWGNPTDASGKARDTGAGSSGWGSDNSTSGGTASSGWGSDKSTSSGWGSGSSTSGGTASSGWGSDSSQSSGWGSDGSTSGGDTSGWGSDKSTSSGWGSDKSTSGGWGSGSSTSGGDSSGWGSDKSTSSGWGSDSSTTNRGNSSGSSTSGGDSGGWGSDKTKSSGWGSSSTSSGWGSDNSTSDKSTSSGWGSDSSTSSGWGSDKSTSSGWGSDKSTSGGTASSGWGSDSSTSSGWGSDKSTSSGWGSDSSTSGGTASSGWGSSSTSDGDGGSGSGSGWGSGGGGGGGGGGGWGSSSTSDGGSGSGSWDRTSSSVDSSDRWKGSSSSDGGGHRSGGGGGGRGCYKCGESGHFARECPNGGGSGRLPEAGSICQGKVMSVGKKDGRPFGLFVRPEGCDQDGLVYKLNLPRQVDADDEDSILDLVGGQGALVNVRVISVKEENGKTRLSLSMKDVDQPERSSASRDGGGDYNGGGRNMGGDSISSGGGGGWNATDLDLNSDNGSGGRGHYVHPERARLIQESLGSSALLSSSSSPAPAAPASGPASFGAPQPQPQPQPQPPAQGLSVPYFAFLPSAGAAPQTVYVPAYAQQPFYQPPSGPQQQQQQGAGGGLDLNVIHANGGGGASSSSSSSSSLLSSFPPPQALTSPTPPPSLLSPTLTPEEEAVLQRVSYALVDLNAARLGRITLMRWYRHCRETFVTTTLIGMLVRVLVDGHGYVGEVVGLKRCDPYFLSSTYERLVEPPTDRAKLARALDHTMIRVTFKLLVRIPGLDEGRATRAYAVSTQLFTHQEMARWLVGREAEGQAPLTAQEIADKAAFLARVRAKCDEHHRQPKKPTSPAGARAPAAAKPVEEKARDEENVLDEERAGDGKGKEKEKC